MADMIRGGFDGHGRGGDRHDGDDDDDDEVPPLLDLGGREIIWI